MCVRRETVEVSPRHLSPGRTLCDTAVRKSRKFGMFCFEIVMRRRQPRWSWRVESGGVNEDVRGTYFLGHPSALEEPLVVNTLIPFPTVFPNQIKHKRW